MSRIRARLLSVSLLAAVAGVATLTSAPPVAQAGDSALDAFRAKHEAVVKLVEQDASDAKLQAKVDGLLDYEWIATAALGGPKHYSDVCKDQCDAFKDLLTQLIRENYLRMIRKAEGHPVEYVGEVEGRNEVFKVTTRVKVKKNGREQTVTVEYVMHEVSGNWEVRDIITDSVSLAKTYRYEFNRIVKKEGIDGVIRKLEDKLASL